MLEHSPSEFHSSVPGSLHIELHCVWVVLHQLFQLILLEAHCDQVLVLPRLKHDLRFQIVQDLIASKVRVSRQDKKFIFRADTFKRKNHDPFLNHVELRECVSVLDDLVAWKIYPGVKVAQKVADELSSSLEAKILVQEHVLEILNEAAEQSFDQLKSNFRFQLVEELLGSYQVEVKVK